MSVLFHFVLYRVMREHQVIQVLLDQSVWMVLKVHLVPRETMAHLAPS